MTIIIHKNKQDLLQMGKSERGYCTGCKHCWSHESWGGGSWVCICTGCTDCWSHESWDGGSKFCIAPIAWVTEVTSLMIIWAICRAISSCSYRMGDRKQCLQNYMGDRNDAYNKDMGRRNGAYNEWLHF